MEMQQEQPAEDARLYGQIIARAWVDDDFKARFLADPGAVMRDAGMNIPAGTEVRALENTDRVLHLVVPPRPDGEVSEEELTAAAGGGSTVGTGGSAGTAGTMTCPVMTLFCVGSAGTAGTA
jgi:hypothetical protein